ncbi:hypothetical protein A2U01_0033585, partial [Trifolium medium]|nr:hypothetical protein [Trifolium medium]
MRRLRNFKGTNKVAEFEDAFDIST